MEGFILDKFIVDGVHYDYMPGAFDALNSGGPYGVRADRYPALNGTSIVVIQSSTPTVYVPYLEQRKARRQAWRATFSEDSWMDLCMYDHLHTLHSLQKTFWVQFDDEMSRQWANCFNADSEYRAYFTPTYPIAPFGYTPLNGQVYNATVRVNGVVYNTGFSVYSDTGMIVFNAPLGPNDRVEMRYTWRAYVRISEFDVQPHGLAQHTYVGTIVLEQVNPNYSSDPWPITLPCNITSEPTDPTVNSDVTGGTNGTLESLPSDSTYGTDGTGSSVGTDSSAIPPDPSTTSDGIVQLTLGYGDATIVGAA